jgi:hypothetical protein
MLRKWAFKIEYAEKIHWNNFKIYDEYWHKYPHSKACEKNWGMNIQDMVHGCKTLDISL